MKLKSENVEQMKRSTRPKARIMMNLLEEFLESGNDIMEVDTEGEDVRLVARNLYQLTYQHNMPVAVHQRANTLYLERKKEVVES